MFCQRGGRLQAGTLSTVHAPAHAAAQMPTLQTAPSYIRRGVVLQNWSESADSSGPTPLLSSLRELVTHRDHCTLGKGDPHQGFPLPCPQLSCSIFSSQK